LSNGYFSFFTDKVQIGVYVLPVNAAVSVVSTSDHSLGTGSGVYFYRFGVQITNPSFQEISVPSQYTVNSQFPAPYFIAQTLIDAWDALWSGLGLVPSGAWVFWDSLNTQFSGSYFGRYEIDGTPIIYVNNSDPGNPPGGDQDFDEWDPAVIMHEYGHFVVYSFLEIPPYAFGEHYLVVPPRDTVISGVANRPIDLAFDESIADLIQAFLRNSPIYTDSSRGSALYTSNFELPKPDAPYTVREGEHSQDNPICKGGHVEGALNATFWDILDHTNDDNYYIGSVKWGTNNDHNSSDNWATFGTIWDVLKNFDPQPNNNNHNHPWNWYEFMEGWRKLGHPINQNFRNIARSHNMYLFRAGNLSNDTLLQVTSLDLSCLVSYLTGGGYVIPYPSTGDVNSDGVVDSADLSTLIAYLTATPGIVLLPGRVRETPTM
jgi:hypothetical protein